MGFYWVLISFTWFYWVLLGFTGFYWVLLGFTGFLKRVHQMVTRKYVGGGFSWIPNAHLRPSISSTKSSFFGRVWHWSSWKKERGRGKGREGVRGKRGGGPGGSTRTVLRVSSTPSSPIAKQLPDRDGLVIPPLFFFVSLVLTFFKNNFYVHFFSSFLRPEDGPW